MLKTLFALVFVVFSGCLQAADLRILTVDEPPSSFVDAEGEASGFAVDVVKAIQAKLGDQTPITFMPEIRVLKTAAERPNVLLFGFSKTPQREQRYHMITLLLRKPWVLYALNSYDEEINTLADAKAKARIGVVRGDVRSIYLQQLGFEKLQRVPYHELNVRMLLNQRVDMIFYEPLGLAYACKSLGIDPSRFKAVLKPEASDVYLMMSKSGTDPELVEKWQQAAEALKEDGVFEQIAQKWSEIIFKQTGVQSQPSAEALNF